MSNLYVFVKEPTRLTLSSATCLDNVISNVHCETTIVEEHLSEHCGQKFIFQMNSSLVKTYNEKITRKYNDQNHLNF